MSDELEIKACRLGTGEYMIGRVSTTMDQEGAIFKVTDPLLFEVMPGPEQGKIKIGMQAHIPLGQPGQSVTMKHKDVMFWIEDLNAGIVSQYEQVTSLIEVPKKNPPKLVIAR